MTAMIIYLVCCFLIVQAIRDQEKFKEEMQPIFQKCADSTGYSKEAGESLVWSSHVPYEDEEAKCFLACYYEKIEATKDSEFWMKGKTEMNVYTEILNCLGTGAVGQDPCELASDIRRCYNLYIANHDGSSDY